MNNKTAKERQVLIEIAEGYVSAKIALEALYPEALLRSIENYERCIEVNRIETFEMIIDFWYINNQKEFEYSDVPQWMREGRASE